jgi:anti-sigma B factor antagonist
METENVGNVLLIALPARMDAASITAIEGDFAQRVKEHKGKVLVDMSRVEFVASLALRLLLTQLKAAQQAGGDLRLSGLRPAIAEVFRKSRFDTLFTIYPDQKAALAAFNG